MSSASTGRDDADGTQLISTPPSAVCLTPLTPPYAEALPLPLSPGPDERRWPNVAFLSDCLRLPDGSA